MILAVMCKKVWLTSHKWPFPAFLSTHIFRCRRFLCHCSIISWSKVESRQASVSVDSERAGLIYFLEEITPTVSVHTKVPVNFFFCHSTPSCCCILLNSAILSCSFTSSWQRLIPSIYSHTRQLHKTERLVIATGFFGFFLDARRISRGCAPSRCSSRATYARGPPQSSESSEDQGANLDRAAHRHRTRSHQSGRGID